MSYQFESAGDLSQWPKNVPGKPTQAAVFGLYHPVKGRSCQILWTASFPDLDPAMYWVAKKEVHAVRRDRWIVASRVLWQHDLTPEQAVAAVHEHMRPQLDQTLDAYERGEDPELAPGALQPVDHAKAQGIYFEIDTGDDGDGLSGWIFNDPPKR